MAYGDGGFFFTQPVGNGYSGLGAFSTSMVRGASPGIRSSSISSYCLSDGAVCTSAELKAEMDRIAAIWSARGLTMAQRRASPWWPTFTALRRKYYQLTTVPTLPPLIAPVISMTRVVPSEQSSPDLPDLSMMQPLGPGPMPMLSAEQAAEMGLVAPDEDVMFETVSAETEEPEGLMGLLRQNMLVSAAVIGAVAFFGFRFAKRQGMIA